MHPKPMPSLPAHTPLPWTVDYSGSCALGIMDSQDRLLFSSGLANEDGDEDEANAAFIVRAVNAFPALVEALENILADCQTADERRTSADLDFAVFHAIEYARTALKLVKGGQP